MPLFIFIQLLARTEILEIRTIKMFPIFQKLVNTQDEIRVCRLEFLQKRIRFATELFSRSENLSVQSATFLNKNKFLGSWTLSDMVKYRATLWSFLKLVFYLF